jgi:hypothetical protein
MFKLQKRLIVLFFLCCAFILKAQHNLTLEGKITSSNGSPISFCHIVLKNDLTKGVLSDYKGNFSIDVNKNDTLLVKYIGYKSTSIYVKDFDNKPIKLKQKSLQLKEFVITQSKKELSAKKIMKLAIKNNENNYLSYNKDNQHIKNTEVDIQIKTNDNDLYLFKGNINIYLIKNRLHIDKIDKKYKTQNLIFTEKFININGAHPYSFVPNLYSKLEIDTKHKFEFGEITNYKGVEVYQIKYYRPEGNGICESAGMYFVTKKNYNIIYVESITTKKCMGLDFDTEKLNWKYGIVKQHYKRNLRNIYDVSKVECETKFDYEFNGEINTFFHKNVLTVNNTKNYKDINSNNLIYAKDFFLQK